MNTYSTNNSDFENTKRKSSEQLEKEVIEKANQVERDFDALEEKLTPGQLIDDYLFHGREATLKQSYDHVKESPTGAALIVLGSLLMRQDVLGRSNESIGFEKAGELKRKVETKVGQASAKVQETVEAGKQRLEQAKAGATDSTTQTTESVKQYGHQIMDNPWAVMAAGLALGAVTGAGLPTFQKEQEVVDRQLPGTEHVTEDFVDEFKMALKDSTGIFRNRILSSLMDQRA